MFTTFLLGLNIVYVSIVILKLNAVCFLLSFVIIPHIAKVTDNNFAKHFVLNF